MAVAPPRPELDLATLERVQRRVLWLATAIVHHANRVRPARSEVKVGGHQASSASMVSLMTALWFGLLEAPDRVSVKPHASPVLQLVSHLLALQTSPSSQRCPQPPQLAGSLSVRTQAPLHSTKPSRHSTLQAASWHVALPLAGVGQSRPHSPQLAGLVRVSTQESPQASKPEVQVKSHVPSWHDGTPFVGVGQR